MELLSHPNKLLQEHLLSVGNSSKQKLLSMNLNLSLIDKNTLVDICYLIGIAHDFGKIDSSFQEFIHEVDKNGNSNKSHSPHAEISSFFLWLLLTEYFQNNNKTNISPISSLIKSY